MLSLRFVKITYTVSTTHISHDVTMGDGIVMDTHCDVAVGNDVMGIYMSQYAMVLWTSICHNGQ